MSYSKSKRRGKNSERLIELVKARTELDNTSRQPTLESFGFHISHKSGGNPDWVTSSTDSSQIPICYPFVKWAGGKRQIVPQLYALVPPKFDRYFEPFLGGGALFFKLISDKNKQFPTYISEINHELINAYVAVKDNVEKLIILLTQYKKEYKKCPKEYSNKLRENYNFRSRSDRIERAAQFITLNRTCFNGLYRVNRNGLFNVPLVKYKNPAICDSGNLRIISHVLSKPEVIIKAADDKEMLLENAKECDFIYLDPPYSPVSSTAYFTSYMHNGFSNKDQEKLAEIYKQLDEMKCKVMLTNSNTSLVRELYADFAKYTTEVGSKRAINCKASKREGHTDLIIRNY
jgi:DNA adenine methylase